MKKLFPAILAIIALLLCNNSFAQVQKKDKGTFVEPKSEFWDSIKKSAEDFSKKDDAKKKAYQLDFSNYKIPQSIDEFNKQWHNEPISQGWTGTCWCFSTTSYLESEVNRQFGKKLKISEIYTVYWEYVEKARRFVTEHGNSAFGEGSEANAVTRIWKQYGCVPEEAYTGLKPGQTFHDHTKLFDEMNNYLQSVKKSSSWNEETVLSTIKSILNQFLGVPPEFVVVDGKKMTPLEYFHNVVKINPDDYIDIYSIMEKPYYEKVEYEVTDNWWKSTDYYNVPLDVFMNTLKNVVKKGYTVAIGGDVSEAGYESHSKAAIVPSFDIPSEYIDENARQFRFSNGTTTDDHGIHLVGYKEQDGKYWFLIKDSGSGSRNVGDKGYFYYQEDYVKLKMMNFMVHKSAVEDLLKKFK